jgi:uncharacterized protein (DUF885 family)
MRFASTLALLVGLAAGCGTTDAAPRRGQPAGADASDPDSLLQDVREARRLDFVLDQVIEFRSGLLSEALDRGRVDREDRADAASRRLAELSLLLDRTRVADVDSEVDRDLGRMVLDAAIHDLALAHARETALRHLAGGATALAFLADPAPPSQSVIELFSAGADGVYPRTPPQTDGASAPDLRHAAARNRQIAKFLRTRGAQAQVLDRERGQRAHDAAAEAAGRAEAFAKVLDERAKELSKDEFGSPVGREAYVALLRTRHGVDASPEDLVAFGEEMLEETERDLAALAAAEFPGRTWRQAIEEIRGDHCGPDAMAGEAFVAAESARDFTIREGFVTIPDEARLVHMEMVDDAMAKSYPFAAYSYRLATAEGESGRYVVSPGATWMDSVEREERLRGNCRAWTRVVAPHETWPGHHLQFFVADHTVPRIRREMTTPVFVEGWGFYCEGLLDRHGFFEDAATRLACKAMRAWRACRVVIDAKLQCGEMTSAEAIAFLVEHAALPRDGATAEVRRYLDNPSQPFSYAWGCREIERLYADEQARLGPAFDERAFHDRLLRCGAIPFRFVRRIFGYGDG